MTVAELIEALADLPLDAEVWIANQVNGSDVWFDGDCEVAMPGTILHNELASMAQDRDAVFIDAR